jgi:hypothetical protein
LKSTQLRRFFGKNQVEIPVTFLEDQTFRLQCGDFARWIKSTDVAHLFREVCQFLGLIVEVCEYLSTYLANVVLYCDARS